MTSRTPVILLTVAMLVLAGCAGTPVGDVPSGDGSADGESAGDGGAGTVNFYVSDEENAIEEFEHLNVTITTVGFKKGGEADDEDDRETPENETEPTPTDDEAEPTPTENGSTGTETTETERPDDDTEVDDEQDKDDSEADDERDEEEDDEKDGDEEEEDGGQDGDEPGGWVTHEVDERTVDLTELRGTNATRLGNFSVETGTYETVFVHVGEVEGTLESGEQVNVKLPSEKLQVHRPLTVTADGAVDFVFDITVHRAGKSGKYVLKPVVSESGTDVEIEDVEEKRGEEKQGDEKRDGERQGGEKSDETDEHGLDVTLAGDAAPGENATVTVETDGDPVANATVEVNDEVAGRTASDGTVDVRVPEGEKTVKIRAKLDDATGELELKFEAKKDDEGDGTDD